ncbi:hypothetical protein LSS_18833 [Leptospira santarosai serovar Shermani str. LT 821]|uniref:Uncharacterized protein n=1 Tax=Leptospira santarosai serovar Shermani str. LT 821 TaxID=758847 RepID=K8Y3A4_9LEPT|nr:hypothetical protein LSS_18833 [Leptospira santarosai serovar Shermani str. LT 821]
MGRFLVPEAMVLLCIRFSRGSERIFAYNVV